MKFCNCTLPTINHDACRNCINNDTENIVKINGGLYDDPGENNELIRKEKMRYITTTGGTS
jgi:hypothetical protein